MSTVIEGLRLDLANAKSYPGIRFIPVISDHPTSNLSVHRFLWEGMEDKSIQVEELPNSSVPTVTLKNNSQESFLTYRGTIIRGGGQNRQMVHSFVVPEQKTIHIPVQCIQQGRWNPHHQREFMNQRGEVTSSTMRFKTKSQSDTWSTITESSHITSTVSRSMDYTVCKDYYVGNENESSTATRSITTNSMEEQRKREQGRNKAQTMLHDLDQPLANQVGMYVIMVDVEELSKNQQSKVLYCLESFASPDLYKKVHKEVVSSFVTDMAMVRQEITTTLPEPTQAQFEEFLQKVKQAPWQKKDGIGKESRQELPASQTMFGESIAMEDQVVHLMCSMY